MKHEKGLSLYLAFMIMSILLAIALGLSSIFLGQAKMVKTMGDSVVAFYAADTGIEKVLVGRTTPNLAPGYYDGNLANEATYQVFITPAGGDCLASNYCIKSIGIYKETSRAVEISY